MSQGASNGGGQGAGKSFVSFSRPAAQRIAKAVRVIEAGDRNQPGLTFDHPMPGGNGAKPFRVCTFTGAWSIGSSNTVTFKYQSATPNTAAVQNDLISLPSAGTRNCVIGREGTAWHLINWQWDIVNAATAANLTTTSLRFDTLPVGAVSPISTVTFSVSVATCSTT
jgi:hypothetical protein